MIFHGYVKQPMDQWVIASKQCPISAWSKHPAVSWNEFSLQDLADELRDLRHRSEENLKERGNDVAHGMSQRKPKGSVMRYQC